MVIHMFTHSSPLHSRLFMVYQHQGYSCEQEDLDQALTEFSWGWGETVNKHDFRQGQVLQRKGSVRGCFRVEGQMEVTLE